MQCDGSCFAQRIVRNQQFEETTGAKIWSKFRKWKVLGACETYSHQDRVGDMNPKG